MPRKTPEPIYVLDDLMTLAAFRYCLGRKTYIVSHCVDYLRKHWDQIPINTKALICKEIEKAFETKSYGMEMDKKEWQRILDLHL